MARGQKLAVIVLFASALVCIVFATLRVVQIGRKAGNNTSPSPSWLALWTMIESAVAIGIGCCPAFAVLYRASRAPYVSYDTQGYVRRNARQPEEYQSSMGGIRMSTRTPRTARSRVSRSSPCYHATASSQEELAAETKGIRITTTVQQDVRNPSVSQSSM